MIPKGTTLKNDGAKTPLIWPLTSLHLQSTLSRL